MAGTYIDKQSVIPLSVLYMYLYRADILLAKRVLRLDSLNLDTLDNLEVFALKELYLQVRSFSFTHFISVNCILTVCAVP